MDSKSLHGLLNILWPSDNQLQPPQNEGFPINLVVAVSFGLFVPPRILKGAKYGGLNVHPSLLPECVLPTKLKKSTDLRNLVFAALRRCTILS